MVGLIVDLGGRVEPSKARPRGPRRERSFLEQNGAMPQPANGISHGDAKNTASDDDDIGHFFHLRTVPAVNAAAPTVSRTIAMQPSGFVLEGVDEVEQPVQGAIADTELVEMYDGVVEIVARATQRTLARRERAHGIMLRQPPDVAWVIPVGREGERA